MRLKVNVTSESDKALLAEFFESPAYTAFKKHFIDNGQIIIAQDALMGTEEFRLQAQGKVIMLRAIHEDLKAIAKEVEAKDNEDNA